MEYCYHVSAGALDYYSDMLEKLQTQVHCAAGRTFTDFRALILKKEYPNSEKMCPARVHLCVKLSFKYCFKCMEYVFSEKSFPWGDNLSEQIYWGMERGGGGRGGSTWGTNDRITQRKRDSWKSIFQ